MCVTEIWGFFKHKCSAIAQVVANVLQALPHTGLCFWGIKIFFHLLVVWPDNDKHRKALQWGKNLTMAGAPGGWGSQGKPCCGIRAVEELVAGRWWSLVGTATEPGGPFWGLERQLQSIHHRIWRAAPAEESQCLSVDGQTAGPETKGRAGAWWGGEWEAAAESSMEPRCRGPDAGLGLLWHSNSSLAWPCGELCWANGHISSLAVLVGTLGLTWHVQGGTSALWRSRHPQQGSAWLQGRWHGCLTPLMAACV